MLEVDNIDVFIGKKKIIKDVSFKVKSGAIVGLVGPNGAGKTTIMKTILGLTKFTGNISVNERQVTENNHHALKNVGALIEHPAIYPFLSGKQNLELYSQDANDMMQVISMLEMDSYIKDKAKGYSLGMKQKLGIAIALLNHPPLVILDEPMNGLDVEATISIRKIIKQYAERGTAFLISSHILSELQKVMTTVVLINDGELIVDKSMEEFNRLSLHQYKLDTENNDMTRKLFKTQQIDFSESEGSFLIEHSDTYKVQEILYANKIHLNEMSPNFNFEQIIVSLLEAQRGHHNEE